METIFIKIHNHNIQMLYTKKHSSILNTLEKNNITVNFQCREGFCGVCQVTLLYGKIKYSKKPLACIQNCKILICCCLPITNIQLKL